MKIGMCMFLWTTHVTEAHEPLLRDIRATGFDGVEIPIFEGDTDHYARLGALLDRIGLQRTAVAAMGDPAMNLIGDAAARAAGIAHMRHVIDCTAALGPRRSAGRCIRRWAMFSGQGPTAEEFARSVSSQRAIGDHAATKGVTVGLEALNRFECYLVNTMAALSAHLDEIGASEHPRDV